MHSYDAQKRLALDHALSRLRRAALFAEPALRRRRQEILAVYCHDGKKFFETMEGVLHQKLATGQVDKGCSASLVLAEADLFRSMALKFIAEPAQRLAIEKKKALRAGEVHYSKAAPIKLSVDCEMTSSDEIAQLAWGALSLKKITHPLEVIREQPMSLDLGRSGVGVQLNLQDLSIIECAACYQDQEFDFAFMKQLSDEGAAAVHRITMIVVGNFSIRVDKAIVIAAKALVDPLVGGDADQCCSMLKSRQFPPSWAAQLASY